MMVEIYSRFKPRRGSTLPAAVPVSFRFPSGFPPAASGFPYEGSGLGPSTGCTVAKSNKKTPKNKKTNTKFPRL